MTIPAPYLDAILNLEPGQAYKKCVEMMASDQSDARPSTQAIVYGCEVQFALRVLEDGNLGEFYNFGDLNGQGDNLLWSVLDPRPASRVCFLGAGPYPVTAFLICRRYPKTEVVCVDNDLTGFLLGRAVCEASGYSVSYLYQDAHQADLTNFDVVVMAAMVGERSKLIERLLEETSAELVVRGATSLSHPRIHKVESDFDEAGQVTSVQGW